MIEMYTSLSFILHNFIYSMQFNIKHRNVDLLTELALRIQQPLNMCFVDFKKAFDSISHDKFWVTMMDPLHLIYFLAKLYGKQLAKVKV